MNKNQLFQRLQIPLSLLLLLILSSCAKPPTGTWVSGGKKKQVGNGDNTEVMELVNYTEKEYITFLPDGKLEWKKVENGETLSSQGTWDMNGGIGEQTINVHFTLYGRKITYTLRSGKNAHGEEELSFKSWSFGESKDRHVAQNKNLWHSAFTRVKE